MIKKTAKSIDLSGLDYRDYSEEEKKDFRPVREGYEEAAMYAAESLAKEPDLLSVKGVNYQDIAKTLAEVKELKEAAGWLEKTLEQVEETRRAKLSFVKDKMEKVVQVGRIQMEEEPKIGAILAGLLDHMSEPQKKAAATKKKKAKQEAQGEGE